MKKLIFSVLLAVMGLSMACEPKINTPEEVRIEITSNDVVTIGPEGGMVNITYSLTGGTGVYSHVQATADNETMITAINTDDLGVVRVAVTENTDYFEREAQVRISYDGESYFVTIKQEARNGEDDGRVVVNANQLDGTYFGEQLGAGVGHYWIILSNGGIVDGEVLPNTEFFRFDILGPLAADIEAIKVPDGKYTYDFYNNFKEYTILNLGNSDYTYVDDAGEGWAINFDSAELIVEGNRFELVALVENKEFHVSFEGDYTIGNTTISDSISNLTSDLEIDVSNCDVTLNSYGDYWLCGYCNWVVEFISKKGLTNGVYLVLDLLGTTLDTSSGFVGTYTSAGFEDEEHRTPNFGPGVFVPGVRISDDGVYMQGSLYQRYDNGKGIEQAPLHDGTITISDNGDGTYRILVDAIDDCTPAHKITLDWSGVL